MNPTKNSMTLTMPSDREILITRIFAASRLLVWEAMTDPKHVVHWWGPKGSTLSVCEIDFRPGGSWRFVLRGPDGRECRFKGVYHEITPPERLVATECFDEPSVGCPEWLTTMTLEEKDGATTMQSRILYESREARDGHLASGMKEGAEETFDRLVEHLAKIVTAARETNG
jgi:uncharacterized protein YndB with AHSA1/START domain